MTVREVLDQCRHLQTESQEDISDELFEGVILREHLKAWEKALESVFGRPVKWYGEEVSDAVFRLTSNFGGLQEDQALYAKQCGDHIVIAMVWPWQDNHQVTLKIARFKA